MGPSGPRVNKGCASFVLAATVLAATAAAHGQSDASDAGMPDFVAPAGPLVDAWPPRPNAAVAPLRACSFRAPICVHGADGAAVMRALDATERAWDATTGALAIPAPDADLETRAYDVYLVDRRFALGAITALGTRDVASGMDRASAYTLLDARLASSASCALDATMAMQVARASLFRVAPATDEGSARAETAYLARLATPCALGDLADVDVFQAHPDRAIVDPSDARFDRGAQLFFWWLDASYGAQPGSMVRAMWSLSPTRTPLGAARWDDEPDGFDVLKMSFKDALTSGSTIEDLLAEFGASRALLGPRDDGTELVEARPFGDAIVPPSDWVVDWPTTPRRLASAAPIAPTGSSYVLVRHAGAPAGARLRLEATWETHAAIRWVVVKLDAAGHELGRVTIGAPARAIEAQGTIPNLDGVDAILVAATNVGDPFAPFEPDDEAWEPHAWLLTIAAE